MTLGRYDLWIDGEQVNDANLAGSVFAFDPATNTLTVSDNCDGKGDAALIQSTIDGLTVQIANDCELTNASAVFDLSGNTTITGTGSLTVNAGSAAAFRVYNGAKLTLQNAKLTVKGAAAFVGTETGESLEIVGTTGTATGIIAAVSSFDGGITLTGCRLTGTDVVKDGAVEKASGGYAAETGFELQAATLPGDVNGDGVVNAKDVTFLRRSLAGGYGVTVSDAIADVNKDGEVNAKDVTFLRGVLAGGYESELS